ncbi:MAG: FtsB family cell division protein [Micromonosporaceae bacterium]
MSQRKMPSGQGPARGGTGGRPGVRPGLPRARTHRPAPPDLAGGARPSTAARRAGRARGDARTPAKRPPAKRLPAKRIWAPRSGRLSGRGTALVLVVAVLALAYAYPLRVYLAQQAEIDRLVTSQEQQRQRIVALTEALSKWDDDEYVITQARWRLKYVRPGEVAYIVVDDQAGPGSTGTRPATGTGSWVGQVWSTIRAADGPGPGESGPS